DLQERQQRNEEVICDFKGKIKDLNNHLDNDCPLQRSDCQYKQFGCEHSCPKHKLNDHLSSQSKLHFDLIEENQQLKLQVELNEKNSKLTNENITLKKENKQLQQEMKTIQKESQQELLKRH
ncbi:viral A-type inclusion protein, partial [Reticulomyxa filosa]